MLLFGISFIVEWFFNSKDIWDGEPHVRNTLYLREATKISKFPSNDKFLLKLWWM